MRLHTEPFTQKLFHTEAFAHKKLWHTKDFYTQKLLYTKAFYTQRLATTDAFTCKEKLLHTEAFDTQQLLHTQTLLHTNAVTYSKLLEALTHRHFYTQIVVGKEGPTWGCLIPKEPLFRIDTCKPSQKMWIGSTRGFSAESLAIFWKSISTHTMSLKFGNWKQLGYSTKSH